MDMHKGEALASRDIYFDYGFETVTYRWDYRTVLTYARLCGTARCPEPVTHHNRLFSDALRFGREISHEKYERGPLFH